ncbi:type I restriction endonuclease subunit R [Methanoplanus limicola]|uniref:Restriction endonuclease, type I, EcoRI, R subunit/Type III n=1 Tax=Methanoplanus limicola DSM 2279 TaxID=937775 RepID=H1Z2Z4_9EURY|nr:type I restriction endonuclease [Methanoplanus limicola]EHQ34733.1 Restriction endonuclease, type I, EcoRI, R subunit/Type III [Methanoplanus limicola DSM 2279]
MNNSSTYGDFKQMAAGDYTEKQFETDIEYSLCTDGGYVRGNPEQFNRTLALDTETLLTFIKTTQPKEWKKYTSIYGSESEKAFLERFTRETARTGIIRVLRQGINDRGCRFRVIYRKPETAINEESKERYEQNILHCTRQLHYSPANENSLDIVLFVNGIPVVSIELKNQFTGQNAANAIGQYRFDRNSRDPIFEFKQRIIVHFAIDLCNVYMTTRLNGAKTKFIPFNQGSNGAGEVGGAGNPLTYDRYQTSYLWEKVLTKDCLLEILHKYLHIKTETVTDSNGKTEIKETLIFPRYHQLDVVTKLLSDVKENGAGKNYLIQHSAGSGKSNSIAWLAHRLSGLHDSSDEKIFKSTIVVTDRKVLDSQLQDTIYQFDHVQGVVVKIDKNSKQLRDAINSGAGIIITTLQKFPVIFKEIRSENRNFAVIVDEAHSSQTGEAAKKLKTALADTEEILEEYAKAELEEEEKRPDEEDKLVAEIAAQGQHKNLSFFAFTATPKDKTLQMFGVRQPDGTYRAYHIYSMRQAIEEGFILDVLKNYMTYSMYYRIIKNIPDDPELDTAAGIKAIRRYESLHPHNLAQKTAIMVEHFRNRTKNQIGGRAKAMVVTPSRLHAVRYCFEFKRYIKDKGYTDLDVLVAFSGEITDDGTTWTEEKINRTKSGEQIKEKQLPKEFHENFNILIVAEKYQTGFDEPYLHTMFVDKKLSGVKAVQTLSRINRTAEGKESTFVLDFVNSAEDIQKAFQQYYEATILAEETDPNVLYDLKYTLDDFRVYREPEINSFAEIFFADKEEMGRLSATLRPAMDRFAAKSPEDRETFRTTLSRFIRIYGFITQVCRMFDPDLHKFSAYAKFLSTVLPKGEKVTVDLDDKILLQYYRLEKNFAGSIVMDRHDDYSIDPIKGEAGAKKEKKDTLTKLLDRINEKFGTDFTEMDKVLLQIENDIRAEESLVNFAQNNDERVFRPVFEKVFKDIAIQRYEQNDEFFIRMFNDSSFMQYTMDLMRSDIYRKIRTAQV